MSNTRLRTSMLLTRCSKQTRAVLLKRRSSARRSLELIGTMFHNRIAVRGALGYYILDLSKVEMLEVTKKPV